MMKINKRIKTIYNKTLKCKQLKKKIFLKKIAGVMGYYHQNLKIKAKTINHLMFNCMRSTKIVRYRVQAIQISRKFNSDQIMKVLLF